MLSKHKWLTIIGVVMMFFLVTGCSDSKSTEEKEGPKSGTETNQTNPPEPTTKLESDVDLAQHLEAEKGIDSVMVQVVDGEQRAVNVDIVINNEQDLSADEVIEKYGKVIKERYPDRTIDIIVAKDGALLKQTTLK